MGPQNGKEAKMAEEMCCPEFDPAPWDGQTFEWHDKRFIKGRVFTLFFMPLRFGSLMRRLMGLVETAGAETPDYLALSDHTSPWNMDVYLAVDRTIPGAENTTLSGTFVSKVYEGPFQKTKEWMKDFESVTAAQGLAIDKTYMWYTTCPKCAKKYGKNYVVIVGRTT
jgi:hypothetical protein